MPVYQTSWYPKPLSTFSDAFSLVKQILFSSTYFRTSLFSTEFRKSARARSQHSFSRSTNTFLRYQMDKVWRGKNSYLPKVMDCSKPKQDRTRSGRIMKARYPLPILLKSAKFEFGIEKKRIEQRWRPAKKRTHAKTMMIYI